MKAVIYARYSSHSQRDCSIEQQVKDCEAYARMNDLEVVGVYADRHLSGTSDKRPEFQRLLRDAAHGRWQYVICWKIDRFARNRYDSATYKFKLKRHGVKVLYAKESIPEGPEGILLESVLEGSAEYYSANLSQNIKRGLAYNAQQCKVNSGSLPYGYKKGEDGRYAINEGEAEVVREIFRKYLQGVTFVDMANGLNARGIKTKMGKLWRKSSFFFILINEVYTGVYKYGDTRTEGGVPVIISKEDFDMVQRTLKEKKHPRGRQSKDVEYLLTGKLKCGHCGSYMIGLSGTSRSGELHHYYGCQKRKSEKTCDKKNVKKEWIEQAVTRAVLQHVLTDDVMEWMAEAVVEYQSRDSAAAVLESLKSKKADCQKALGNVMKAIEMGIITETTKNRLVELEKEIRELNLNIQYEEASCTHLTKEQILFWLSKFKGGNANDREFQRKIIDTFVNTIYLYDDDLRIVLNYTGRKNEVTLNEINAAETDCECSYKVEDCPPNTTYTNIYFIGTVFVLRVRKEQA